MPRTFLRQDTQIRQSDLFDGTLAPGSTLESGAASLEGDLNSLRSQVYNLMKKQVGGNWYDDLSAPSNYPTDTPSPSKRGVDNVNTDLREIERKRVLVSAFNYTAAITVTALQNWQVLTLGQLPAQTTAAIGAVTTLGTVAAFNASFGAHSMAAVAGSGTLAPKNLCEVVDAVTHDPILSSGRTIYALFQTESNTDGSTMSGTTPNRAQLSFVRINTAGTALEACPVADIAGKVVDYVSVQRKGLSDLNEQDFLRGASTDTPASSSTSRQGAYDAQGTTPVELLTNADLDLNSAGIFWRIRDLANADLFTITEGSTGGTTDLTIGTDVDTLNVNAILNNFNKPIKADISGQEIDIGVTTGTIESTGVNDLRLYAANDLFLDDLHQTGSTWTGTSGVRLSAATGEWDTYKTNYGEVSLLNAINQAKNPAAQRGTKVYALVTLLTNADTDVGGVGGGTNLDAQLPNMSGGSFLTSYDVFLNGNLLRPGANSGANHDYYPGTSLANGQLKFEFKVKVNDVLCVIPYA